jgi:hypothetical protein
MSPWTDEFDDASPVASGVEPKPTTAKVIGILNIIFASLLLLCGLCAGFYVLIFSSMGSWMGASQSQLQRQWEAGMQDAIAELEAREKAARTDEEKKRIQDQIKSLKELKFKAPDFSKLMGDQRIWGYLLADVVTMLILNVVMLISGIGLVNLTEWGRKTGIWVAALKIFRLVVLYGFFILVIAPLWANQFISFFEEMENAMPKGLGLRGARQIKKEEMAAMGATMGAMMTGYAIAIAVAGVIYPIITLCLLTRPGVKAACAGRHMERIERPPPREGYPPHGTDWTPPQ